MTEKTMLEKMLAQCEEQIKELWEEFGKMSPYPQDLERKKDMFARYNKVALQKQDLLRKLKNLTS